VLVAETAEGPVWTGKLQWMGTTDRSIGDAIESASSSVDRTATGEAADWLADFVSSHGGSVESALVKREGAQAGHSADALKRARKALGIVSTSAGFHAVSRFSPATCWVRLRMSP
jgi:hypothetical protein